MADPAVSKLMTDPDREDPSPLSEASVDTARVLPSPPAVVRSTPVAGAGVLRPKAPEPDAQEVDLWWGSYAARTMTPSLLVCIALTGLIAWAAWVSLPRGLVQLTILGLAGAVWLFQGVRWCYRVFGYNYRLTTRRLLCTKGLLLTRATSVPLADVARVQVKYAGHEKLLGVGKIVVHLDSPTQPPLVLDGVRAPERMAERIREFVEKARATQVLEGRISSV